MAPWLSHYNSIHPISDPDCNENKLRIKKRALLPLTFPFISTVSCILYKLLQTAARQRRTLVCNYLNATFLTMGIMQSF